MTSLSTQWTDFSVNGDAIGEGSIAEKVRGNLEAVRLYKSLAIHGRAPARDEQSILARYAGWGFAPQVFDPQQDRFSRERDELQQLLTPVEWSAAEASTPNAHYTPIELIRLIWAGLERLGFQGGAVLEPAAGVGNFIGAMPQTLFQRSEIYAVEPEAVAAGIMRYLYPSITVVPQRIQETSLREGTFDLAVTNVPFGNYAVSDRRYDKTLRRAIHDYFFVRMLDLVRPGGLVVAITSRFTMDKKDTTVRQYLAERSDLLAAIRLPVDAFESNAHTKVTTDVLFLRRRGGDAFGNASWVDVVPQGGYELNEYYTRHSEMMLGRMRVGHGRYDDSAECHFAFQNVTLEEKFAEALLALPRDVIVTGKNYCPVCGQERGPGLVCACHYTEALKIRGEEVPSGALYIGDDGQLRRNEDGETVIIKASGTTLARYRGLIALRDLAKEVLRLNTEGTDDELAAAQKRLHWQWKMFVRRYDAINTPYNRRLIAGDPDAPLLWSIEEYDPDSGDVAETSFFERRVLDVTRVEPSSAETPHEALTVSLAERGRVDWEYISQLTGRDKEDLQNDLYGMVFEHLAGRWYWRDQYLSGNVREKLEEARELAEVNPRYQINVEALESVLPKWLGPAEIVVNLGAGWVPSDDVSMFITELLDSRSPINSDRDPADYHPSEWERATAKYVEHLGHWAIDVRWRLKNSAANTKKWGTDRMTAADIIESTVNGKAVTVRDEDFLTGASVINEQETMAARAMQKKIRDAFQEWVWRDAERADRLLEIYNVRFNSIVPQQYDGSHLTLPGLGTTVPQFRDYQLAAIWRIMQGGNHLIWHEVGLGKTYVMICAGMEMRRLGLRNRVVHVVMPNTLWDYATSFQKAYPGASLLIIDSKDLRPQKRQEMLNRIVTRDWDAIIMTHQAFRKIPIRKETFDQWLEVEIQVLEEYLFDLDRIEDRASVKELQKAKQRLEAKLAEKEADADEHRDDNIITWEDLGVDMLFVDEAHLFKNLYFSTSRTRVPGINNNDSQRAWDMFLKVQYLCRRDSDGNLLGFRRNPVGLASRRVPGTVVFATGTAIPNSVCELYVAQRYLQFDRLLDLGLGHFDAWANLFGEDVTVIEMQPSGKGYRQNTRFIRFHNVPELLRIFGEVADTQVDDGTLGLPKPKLATGEPIPIIAEPTDALLEYIDYCAKRAANLHNVDPTEDNILKVMHDATYAALDMRLVAPNSEDEPDSKINLCVENVVRIYHETTGQTLDGLKQPANLTQMIFLDKSTPKKGFNLYDDIKQKLVASGIPAREVVFIHDAKSDAQKQQIFDAMNRGEVRVLLGSTSKMGMGTNAQRLLYALHHLDAPWRPADIDQREGRILRQGNLNPEVWIYRYATAGSFDVYRWQLLEHKAAFVAQIMKATLAERSIEDVDAPVIGFAEMKALSTGDPAVLEKVKIDTEITGLKAEREAYEGKIRRLRYDLANLPRTIEKHMGARANYARALSHIASTAGRPFEMVVNGDTFKERRQAGEALLGYLETLRPKEMLPEIVRFRDCTVDAIRRTAALDIKLKIAFTDEVAAQIDASEDPVGICRRIENAFDQVRVWDQNVADEIDRLNESLPVIEEQVGQAWEKAEYLDGLVARSRELQAEIDERAKQEHEGENKWVEADETLRHAGPRVTGFPDPGDEPLEPLEPRIFNTIRQMAVVKQSGVYLGKLAYWLDAPTYEQVEQVITHLGGKWVGSVNAHVFLEDPRPGIQELRRTN